MYACPVEIAVANKVKYPEFAQRMKQAADANPRVPLANYGRLQWLVDEMGKLGHEMVMETARKWFAGETMPRNAPAKLVAQVLTVTPAWLALGDHPPVVDHDTKQRNALASGAVNLVAGMVQMAGWSVAFPTPKDGVDLQAIIRGAMYSFHVVVGVRTGGDWDFAVPSIAIDNFVIGVCQLASLQYVLVELDKETLEVKGRLKGGVVYISVPDDFIGSRRIESFAARL